MTNNTKPINAEKKEIGMIIPKTKSKFLLRQKIGTIKNNDTGIELDICQAINNNSPIIESKNKYYWLSWEDIAELAIKYGILED